RVGTLDNPDLLAPNVHIFTRSKHPAVQLPTDVPAFDISYDREQLWPAESLARLKAMKRAD
ncbi:MAG: aldehyde-activating protein, partial [SAR324 cluster bacterium]|nr:aldehyde-activating protein [SAR324 cluster bacterium]